MTEATCPHACTDGWLRPDGGKATRCPWCERRQDYSPGPPISLFEQDGRQGLDDARSVLARAVRPPRPGPTDPIVGMTAAERAEWFNQRANARYLGITTHSADEDA